VSYDESLLLDLTEDNGDLSEEEKELLIIRKYVNKVLDETTFRNVVNQNEISEIWEMKFCDIMKLYLDPYLNDSQKGMLGFVNTGDVIDGY